MMKNLLGLASTQQDHILPGYHKTMNDNISMDSTITWAMNDNINMDSTITGVMNVSS